jgi:ribonuclease HII
MPTLEHEQRLWAGGCPIVAGVDEAGRGCWAGPVVAAAVVFNPQILSQPHLLDGIDDSKRMSGLRRETLRATIEQLAIGIGVGTVPAFLIDSLGIMNATRLAMESAILALPVVPHALLIDAVRLPAVPLRQAPLIHGDSLSYSIAAASIIAKTTRDRMMIALEQHNRRYGFAEHKGYGTASHRAALGRWGPCDQHRHSFQPLWNMEYADETLARTSH